MRTLCRSELPLCVLGPGEALMTRNRLQKNLDSMLDDSRQERGQSSSAEKFDASFVSSTCVLTYSVSRHDFLDVLTDDAFRALRRHVLVVPSVHALAGAKLQAKRWSAYRHKVVEDVLARQRPEK